MADILAAGYSDLRAYFAGAWGRVVLYDGDGVAQLTLPAGDARVAWSGTNPRTVTVTLHGSEADVVGKTFARIKVFKSTDTTSSTPLADETFAEGAAGPINALDSLTITHTFTTP